MSDQIKRISTLVLFGFSLFLALYMARERYYDSRESLIIRLKWLIFKQEMAENMRKITGNTYEIYLIKYIDNWYLDVKQIYVNPKDLASVCKDRNSDAYYVPGGDIVSCNR